ncbi:hypothetical protein BCR44DRAFT_309664 [Catenaria anguillulae PL171]|uniref:Uncharacterized protein n=1 Tax=Catenaria anguillulae PL171 TaxID=765915 RepID=A0A1Y2HUJ5_9FUNG|nr:hypothetical protein BCR44DRAFT_309664 [Catenaria anguillulae PL171]
MMAGERASGPSASAKSRAMRHRPKRSNDAPKLRPKTLKTKKKRRKDRPVKSTHDADADADADAGAGAGALDHDQADVGDQEDTAKSSPHPPMHQTRHHPPPPYVAVPAHNAKHGPTATLPNHPFFLVQPGTKPKSRSSHYNLRRRNDEPETPSYFMLPGMDAGLLHAAGCALALATARHLHICAPTLRPALHAPSATTAAEGASGPTSLDRVDRAKRALVQTQAAMVAWSSSKTPGVGAVDRDDTSMASGLVRENGLPRLPPFKHRRLSRSGATGQISGTSSLSTVVTPAAASFALKGANGPNGASRRRREWSALMRDEGDDKKQDEGEHLSAGRGRLRHSGRPQRGKVHVDSSVSSHSSRSGSGSSSGSSSDDELDADDEDYVDTGIDSGSEADDAARSTPQPHLRPASPLAHASSRPPSSPLVDHPKVTMTQLVPPYAADPPFSPSNPISRKRRHSPDPLHNASYNQSPRYLPPPPLPPYPFPRRGFPPNPSHINRFPPHPHHSMHHPPWRSHEPHFPQVPPSPIIRQSQSNHYRSHTPAPVRNYVHPPSRLPVPPSSSHAPEYHSVQQPHPRPGQGHLYGAVDNVGQRGPPSTSDGRVPGSGHVRHHEQHGPGWHPGERGRAPPLPYGSGLEPPSPRRHMPSLDDYSNRTNSSNSTAPASFQPPPYPPFRHATASARHPSFPPGPAQIPRRGRRPSSTTSDAHKHTQRHELPPPPLPFAYPRPALRPALSPTAEHPGYSSSHHAHRNALPVPPRPPSEVNAHHAHVPLYLAGPQPPGPSSHVPAVFAPRSGAPLLLPPPPSPPGSSMPSHGMAVGDSASPFARSRSAAGSQVYMQAHIGDVSQQPGATDSRQAKRVKGLVEAEQADSQSESSHSEEQDVASSGSQSWSDTCSSSSSSSDTDADHHRGPSASLSSLSSSPPPTPSKAGVSLSQRSQDHCECGASAGLPNGTSRRTTPATGATNPPQEALPTATITVSVHSPADLSLIFPQQPTPSISTPPPAPPLVAAPLPYSPSLQVALDKLTAGQLYQAWLVTKKRQRAWHADPTPILPPVTEPGGSTLDWLWILADMHVLKHELDQRAKTGKLVGLPAGHDPGPPNVQVGLLMNPNQSLVDLVPEALAGALGWGAGSNVGEWRREIRGQREGAKVGEDACGGADQGHAGATVEDVMSALASELQCGSEGSEEEQGAAEVAGCESSGVSDLSDELDEDE